MRPVEEENARRWRFLCDNWGSCIDGMPFPRWLETMKSPEFSAAVDEARVKLATRCVDRPNSVVNLRG